MSNSQRIAVKRVGGTAALLWLAVTGAVVYTQSIAAPQSQPQTGAAAQQGSEDDSVTRTRERREKPVAGEQAATQPTNVEVSRFVQGWRVSEGEWEAASKRIKSHSPNVWARMDRMPSDSPARMNMMRSLIERHRDLERVERRDPEQYKRELAQIEIEDQIVGIAREARQASSESEADALKQKLRNLVEKLVDLRFANREARLKRLSDTLAAERERLEADKRARDAAVERHFGSALKGAGRPPREGPPPRRREGREGSRDPESGPPKDELLSPPAPPRP